MNTLEIDEAYVVVKNVYSNGDYLPFKVENIVEKIFFNQRNAEKYVSNKTDTVKIVTVTDVEYVNLNNYEDEISEYISDNISNFEDEIIDNISTESLESELDHRNNNWKQKFYRSEMSKLNRQDRKNIIRNALGLNKVADVDYIKEEIDKLFEF